MSLIGGSKGTSASHAQETDNDDSALVGSISGAQLTGSWIQLDTTQYNQTTYIDPGLLAASENIVTGAYDAAADAVAANAAAVSSALDFAESAQSDALYIAGEVVADTAAGSFDLAGDVVDAGLSLAGDVSAEVLGYADNIASAGLALAGDALGFNAGLVEMVVDTLSANTDQLQESISGVQARESLNNDARLSDLSGLVVKIGGMLAAGTIAALLFKG